MSGLEPQPTESPPQRPGFQFQLRTMLLLFVVLGSSLAVFGAWGIVVFALTVGLAIYLHKVESLRSLVYIALALLCLTCLIGMLVLPAVNNVHDGYRGSCLNRLLEIGLALHRYHQANGCFPPAYIADKNGKPMHSWRVLILPYMEYDTLYRRLDLTQPWDAPKNKDLLLGQLREFTCPSDATSELPGTLQ